MIISKYDYYRIKDECRKGFLKYLAKAVSLIPVNKTWSILDTGCGSGVPTLWLAEHFTGSITAIDSDSEAIKWLEEKITKSYLSDRVHTVNGSFFDYEPGDELFDMILAEGFLNAVGFKKGFTKVKRLLKSKGFFIIHDELKDNEEKIAFINRNNFKLLHSFVLDEKVWWNDYYRCLEKEISSPSNDTLSEFFDNDRKEIEMYRNDAGLFRSIYYILEKEFTALLPNEDISNYEGRFFASPPAGG